MGMSSRLIHDRLATKPSFQAALANVAEGHFAPVPGGILVLKFDGTVIGAVGLSGDSSDMDEYCAITGILGVNFLSERSAPDKKMAGVIAIWPCWRNHLNNLMKLKMACVFGGYGDPAREQQLWLQQS